MCLSPSPTRFAGRCSTPCQLVTSLSGSWRASITFLVQQSRSTFVFCLMQGWLKGIVKDVLTGTRFGPTRWLAPSPGFADMKNFGIKACDALARIWTTWLNNNHKGENDDPGLHRRNCS